MTTNPFWGNIFGSSLFDSDASVALLKNVPIFEEMQYFDLVKISKLFHLRKYFKNEVIFREKEVGTNLYIIKSGEVKIVKDIDNKNYKEIAVLESPAFFGEVSLVDESPRSATAIATQETELLGFFRSDLMTLIDRNPRLSSFFLLELSKVLGKRLTEINNELEMVCSNQK